MAGNIDQNQLNQSMDKIFLSCDDEFITGKIWSEDLT